MLHFERQATCSNMRSRHSQRRRVTCSFCCAKIPNWIQLHYVRGVGRVTCHGLIQHQLTTIFFQLHLPQLRYHCISLSPDGSRRPLICHLNGVRFLTPEQREALGTTAPEGAVEGRFQEVDCSVAKLGDPAGLTGRIPKRCWNSSVNT